MPARRLAAVAVTLLALFLPILPSAQASVAVSRTALTTGGDVSWPNCPKGMGIASRPSQGLPMPVPSARFSIVGATNGPAFTKNPCLHSQVTWARARHLWLSAYSVVSYPTPYQLARYGGTGTYDHRLFRVGIAQARYTLTTLRAAGLRTRMVWVDVESVHGLPWAAAPAHNNALLAGVLAGYRAYHVRAGLYSYASAWKSITGNRRILLPTWVPSGSSTRVSALARCSQRSFSGGRTYLGQWSDGVRDYDVLCPGIARYVPGLFVST
ncbi:MAG: hypothetical protein WCD35_06240 [Mycobacteriales bacterium]